MAEETSHDSHSELGGSSAPRWTRCPLSVAMSRAYPHQTTDYAKEGLCAHGLSEFCHKKGVSAYDAVDEHKFTFDVSGKDEEPEIWTPDEDMIRYVQDYLDRCNDFEGDRYIEPRVSFEPWVKGAWGFIDFVCFDIKGRKVIIRDLKFGMGEQVDAEENEQLMLYAIGAIEEYGMLYDIDTVVMEIDQPRLDHVSSWSISYNELMRRAVWFKERAEETKSADAKAVPGEKQCRWCKAKAECKALADLTYNIVASEFDIED